MRGGIILLACALALTGATGATAAAPADPILTRWPGPYGGLPPVDAATPASIGTAFAAALADYRTELKAIASNREPPTFKNTVAALDRAGRALRRAHTLLNIYATTNADDAWRTLQGELASQWDSVQSDALTDPRLFERVAVLYRTLPHSATDEEARRLTELTYDAMRRSGAALGPRARARLGEIEGELAALRARFSQNLAREAERQFVFVEDGSRLAGLPPAVKAAAATAAEAQGRPGAWAIANSRPAIWAVQTHVADRALRRETWTMWMNRGANTGEFDNSDVIADIIERRGAKARLLGYPTYAHYVLDSRMAGTPQRALETLETAWSAVLSAENARMAYLAELAAEDGVDELQPWDRVYYLARAAEARFGIDANGIAEYFGLDAIVEAMFWAAEQVYGYRFARLDGAATVSPDIAVYRVDHGGEPLGVLYLDLVPRAGKQHGSWSTEYRIAGDGEAGALPVAALVSSQPVSAEGGGRAPVPYEYANVLFHEFGHVLHMLSSQSSYRGTGSLALPWDFIEVPSLLNERWMLSDEVLDRLPHRETGEPMPRELRQRLRASRDFERVFSVNPEFLATALVDLRLHMLADGRRIDVRAFEDAALAEYGLPRAIDPVMRTPHAVHTFTQQYAANVYTYFWSDTLAADLAGVFLHARQGLYDRDVGEAYRELILARGNRVPIAQAYREFHGRGPDPDALMRRYGLQTANVADPRENSQ